MKTLSKIICIIGIFLSQNIITNGYHNTSHLCGADARKSYSFTEIQKDKFISTQLQKFYNDNDICNKINITNYDFSINNEHYIISFTMNQNKIIIQDNAIVHDYDDTEYASLLIGVKLSGDGIHSLHTFIMKERNDFLEKEGYKKILGYYLDGIRVQDDDYKSGYKNFLKKHHLQYYFGTEKIIGSHTYSMPDKLKKYIDMKLQKLPQGQKDIIMKNALRLKREYIEKKNDAISFYEYRKQVIIDYIYSNLKIEELKSNPK